MLAFILLSLPTPLAGQVIPTGPGPNETYLAKSRCPISWTVDSSGEWTNMTIDLMSGSNDNMSYVTNVAFGLDGTDSSLSPFIWTCPEVDPYSSIYFYEFYNGERNVGSSPAWTTRFTIASPSGQYSQPPFSSQPNGDNIPWGSGTLATVADSGDPDNDDSTPSVSSQSGSRARSRGHFRHSRTSSHSVQDEQTGLTSDVIQSTQVPTQSQASQEPSISVSSESMQTTRPQRVPHRSLLSASLATLSSAAPTTNDMSSLHSTPTAGPIPSTHGQAIPNDPSDQEESDSDLGIFWNPKEYSAAAPVFCEVSMSTVAVYFLVFIMYLYIT